MSSAPTTARGRIDQLLAQIARDVAGLPEPYVRQLAPIMAEARRELVADLKSWLGGVKNADDRFTAQRYREALLQLDTAFGVIRTKLPAEMLGLLGEQGDAAAAASLANLKKQVIAHAKHFGGESRVLPLRTASMVERGAALLMPRYRTTLERYGAEGIGLIQRQLAIGMIRNETFAEMTNRLLQRAGGRVLREGWPLEAAAEKIGGGFARSLQSNAERIVRTECINTYNALTDAGIDELEADDPGWEKKWDASEDKRTCAICDWLDGKVIATGGVFAGRPKPPLPGPGNAMRIVPATYRHPPAHPRCRCALVAWRPEWEGRSAAAPAPAPAAQPAPPKVPKAPTPAQLDRARAAAAKKVAAEQAAQQKALAAAQAKAKADQAALAAKQLAAKQAAEKAAADAKAHAELEAKKAAAAAKAKLEADTAAAQKVLADLKAKMAEAAAEKAAMAAKAKAEQEAAATKKAIDDAAAAFEAKKKADKQAAMKAAAEAAEAKAAAEFSAEKVKAQPISPVSVSAPPAAKAAPPDARPDGPVELPPPPPYEHSQEVREVYKREAEYSIGESMGYWKSDQGRLDLSKVSDNVAAGFTYSQRQFSHARQKFSWELNTKEMDACLYYSHQGDRVLNSAYRYGMIETEWDVRAKAKDLISAIKKHPMPKDTHVMRGMSGEWANKLGDLLKPGDSFVEPGFCSTSATTGFDGNVKMRILIPKGAHAAPIPTRYPEEDEFLLPPGTKFRVVKNEKIGIQSRNTTTNEISISHYKYEIELEVIHDE